ncbi:DegT/DnrJ/EryC1/StrS family aminotransferase [candidate division KSB1 bacterium]|nr:DegT/DnrJ/EryC1/StrS family aminotransferase [candidate division KSB1 bacterium]
MRNKVSRRAFVHKTAVGSAAVALVPTIVTSQTAKPALLGGVPVRTNRWPAWPEWRREWEAKVIDVMRSGRWWRGRGEHVADFEKAYADLIGAKRCLATASGTTALLVSMHVLGVDAGDEVIVSPFTFIATYNSILLSKALPVFADTDAATLTMDPKTIETKITDRTTAIMPVHIYGLPCDMDPINDIAKKHHLAVVEDACQAWLAEYKEKKCGTLGDLGCFSFQNSKHLPTGEGGAITGNDDLIMDRCHSFHNCGRAYGTSSGTTQYFMRGSNRRMQQMQAVMLMQQIVKLQEETARRQENAAYLMRALAEVPGIHPIRMPENSKAVWHLFPVRYDAKEFSGLPIDKFVKAIHAEGVPFGRGYHELYFDDLIDEAIQSRGYKRLFSEKRLKEYRESLSELKGNKQVCETTLAITQNLLLGEKKDMDDIVNALQKIQRHSAEVARA